MGQVLYIGGRKVKYALNADGNSGKRWVRKLLKYSGPNRGRVAPWTGNKDEMGEKHMKLTRVVVLAVLIAALLLPGCGKSPDTARKELGQMNIKYDATAFFEAITNNDLVAFKLFLEAGMDPNTTAQIASNPSALMIAANHNRLEMAKMLIDKGANVNSKDKNGSTALMFAISYEAGRNTELIKLLLSKGADANVTNKEGSTALMVAIGSQTADSAEVVKLLLEKGADVNAKSTKGVTALMVASKEKNLTALKLLLAKKPDLEASDTTYKLTALMFAVSEQNLDAAQELIANGANVNAKAAEGLTPLAIAKAKNNQALVDLLLKAGAKEAAPVIAPNAVNRQSVSPRSIYGTWSAKGGSWGMTLQITIDEGYILGTHSAYAQNGNRVDSSRKPSITGRFEGKSPVLVGWRSGYGEATGKAELTVIDDSTISWRIISQSSGEHYLPREAVLRKGTL